MQNTLRLNFYRQEYFDQFGEWPVQEEPDIDRKMKSMHLGMFSSLLPEPSPDTSFEYPIMLMQLDHCIEILRINLMCVSDVTPLLFIDDPGAFGGTSPDFNTMHTMPELLGY